MTAPRFTLIKKPKLYVHDSPEAIIVVQHFPLKPFEWDRYWEFQRLGRYTVNIEPTDDDRARLELLSVRPGR